MTTGVRNKLGYKRAQVRYRILEALDEREYNPTKVASEIGCTLSNVSRVLNGKGHSSSVLNKLRDIGVPEQYLFDPHRKGTA